MNPLAAAATRAVAAAVGENSAVQLRWSEAFERDVAGFLGKPYSKDRAAGDAVAKTLATKDGAGAIIFADATQFSMEGPRVYDLIAMVFTHEGFHARMIVNGDDCTTLFPQLGPTMKLVDVYPWLAAICLNEARVEKAVAELGVRGFDPQTAEEPRDAPASVQFQALALWSAYAAHRGAAFLEANFAVFEHRANRGWRDFVSIISEVPSAAHRIGLERKKETILTAARALDAWYAPGRSTPPA